MGRTTQKELRLRESNIREQIRFTLAHHDPSRDDYCDCHTTAENGEAIAVADYEYLIKFAGMVKDPRINALIRKIRGDDVSDEELTNPDPTVDHGAAEVTIKLHDGRITVTHADGVVLVDRVATLGSWNRISTAWQEGPA